MKSRPDATNPFTGIAGLVQAQKHCQKTCLRASYLSLLVLLGACSGSSNEPLSGNLTPLPHPPLSPAPAANDEPIAEAAQFNTLGNIQLVRDPGPRLPEEGVVELTDEDFNAGPLAAVIQVPDGLDTSVNAAPAFENLTDQQVVAGDVLQVIYKPVDPDGGLPGMFPEELPQGGTFNDNFDGTKTFRWQPLQMDVGIREFTVTALDPVNSLYRTSRTIRIKITLPDDPSTIPNVAPMLDEFIPHTVRLGDPVVLELKGIDLNGTVPSLEIPVLPSGATFAQHPRFDEVYVLKFTASTAGTQTINVRAVDSLDANLTNIEAVTLNVLPRASFARSGARLKTLAAARNINIGYASLQSFYHRPDGAIYADTAINEFNIVTPENSMKMDHINPFAGRYQFADTDNLVNFAVANNMQLHGHPLVWYRQLPEWIESAAPETLEVHMREYISRILKRYKSDISLWDVVNEPLADNGNMRDSIWFKAMGETYIDTAFHQARTTAPDATLLLNEFDIAFNGPKTDAFFALLERLQSRDVPVDGVGFQLHVFSSFDKFSDVQANFDKVANLDLDIYITELDVAMADGATDAEQASVYRQIVDICLQQPRCKAIQTWGFTDQYSFRRIFTPLPFSTSYQEKPAYKALQDALDNN